MQAALVKGYESGTVLYMAMEWPNRRWKLGLGNGSRTRRKSVEARERMQLLEEVSQARRKPWASVS